MKQLTISPTAHLHARVELPASKSISNRALIINALSNSACAPEHVSDCDDTYVMVRALTEQPEVIDIMAAGTAMRFLSAYLSVVQGTRVITGTERMQHRPISILVDALRTLGARVEYVREEGFPPLRITGGNHPGGHLDLPGDVSSQYISALLMIGPVLQRGLELHLTGRIVSRPYIEMTLSIMREFGACAEWEGDDVIRVYPQPYNPIPYYIESDWSASSYWYQMVALSPDADAEVTLVGLFEQSTQGDQAVKDIFARLGVLTEFIADEHGVQGIRIRKGGACAKRLDYDFVNQPDLAQTLVCTCTAMGVPFRFTGLQSLKIKETDRIEALRAELRKFGYVVNEAEDSIMWWDGERSKGEDNPSVDTYEDHRMAMALAPCCLRFGPMEVDNPQVVSKSYPRFWEDLRSAGFNIEEEKA